MISKRNGSLFAKTHFAPRKQGGYDSRNLERGVQKRRIYRTMSSRQQGKAFQIVGEGGAASLQETLGLAS